MTDNINLLAAQADMDAKDAQIESINLQLTNALHDLDVAVDQVGTLTDDVRDAMRRANVAEDNAANLAEQLKTARIGAALVPGLQQQVADLLAKIAKLENPEPEPTPARFPGDPGKGNYRVGWSLERGTTSGWDFVEVMAQPWWNPAVSVIHDYARSSAKLLDRVSAQLTIDNGFPGVSMSMKLGGISGTWTQKCQAILAGTHNAAIDSDADWCQSKAEAGIFFWLCIYHEPENLTAAEAKLLREVTRYVVARFRARGADNVAWQPVYQVPWTFSGSGRDYRTWHPDWDGTKWHADRMMDLLGMDVYNPLPPSAPAVTGSNRVFAEMVKTATVDKAVTAGLPADTPKTMPEFGMGRIKGTADQAPSNGWVGWMTEAIPVMRAQDVVLASYWDNSDDIGRYRLTDPAKKAAWDLLCAGAVR